MTFDKSKKRKKKPFISTPYLNDIVRRIQADETRVGEMGESGARGGDFDEIVVDGVLTREAYIVGHQRETRQAHLKVGCCL